MEEEQRKNQLDSESGMRRDEIDSNRSANQAQTILRAQEELKNEIDLNGFGDVQISSEYFELVPELIVIRISGKLRNRIGELRLLFF